jgi:protein TonB
MTRPLVIFYSIALALHAVVLFCLKPPAPRPPKILNETYVDVTLTAPPPPQSTPPKPQPTPPPPKPVVIPPKPEEKPQPAPPPKPEMTIPEPKPTPPPPLPVVQPVFVPPPQPKPPPEKYISVTELKYAHRVEAIYPDEAKRRHEQGQVTVMIYINADGVLDKVEIVKSSGYPLLDAAAVKAVKESQFNAEFVGKIPVGQWAEQTFTFRLE